MSGKDALYRELERLNGHLPTWATQFMSKVTAPSALWLRMPLGVVLMVGGVVGFFLPLPGFWLLPLGLALLALDVPFMRSPMARLLAYINGKLGG